MAKAAKQPWREVMERADELWEKFRQQLSPGTLFEAIATEQEAKAEYEKAEGERDRD